MRPHRPTHRGLSMLEMIIVVSIMGILALVIVPRVAAPGRTAKINACHVNKGNIETQAQLWFRNKGTWPATDLSTISGNTDYFPDGLPTCPVDGSAYTFNSANEAVIGHTH